MSDVEYRENGDTALLTTDNQGEWIESNSIVLLSEWA
jgi:hypothetical protein